MRRNIAHKYELLFCEGISESSSTTAFTSWDLKIGSATRDTLHMQKKEYI